MASTQPRSKVTHQTVANARRAGIGRKLEMTDTDRARLAAIKDEQTARLARIAARAAGRNA